MKKQNSFLQAFTLVETVTALIVSGIIFVGVFSIFAILNNKFEAELVRGELVAYCNYALDDMAHSIRQADDVLFYTYNNFDLIRTVSNDVTLDIYGLSEDEGIIKNGIPIHNEIEEDITKHKIFYIPQKKNGFLKYILDGWLIYPLDDPPEEAILPKINNDIYETDRTELLQSSFVIELHAKLIMGWDKEKPLKELQFKRIAFSAGVYIESL